MGGYDAPRLALQEAHAGLPFQPLHVLADRGLGAGQLAGDGAEAARPAHGHEDAQVVQSHGPKLPGPKPQLGSA
ncbi:hypothetical protein GCM10011578_059950 [Streptomyces fuscichromogenes]|uniref:Uncharacterized protein n=1 Tax=Streptomyces fuscichromogenes TaxID=1324013 RepID=A0A917XH99_9ACTN|nr:hypothetical protein GCM10011578_059950 [Streptomyces fuscichromogenes]